MWVRRALAGLRATYDVYLVLCVSLDLIIQPRNEKITVTAYDIFLFFERIVREGMAHDPCLPQMNRISRSCSDALAPVTENC